MARAHASAERWLSPEQLVRRYAATGRRRDLDRAFHAFLPLARSLAGRYRRTSVPRDDLHQAAALGLVKALRRFDPARGCAFTTFAVPTILGELRRQCREAIWPAHVPRPVRERVLLLRATSERMSAELRRSPTVAELAGRLSWDEDLVLDAIMAANGLASTPLDPAGGDGDEHGAGRPADRIGAEDPGYELAECRAVIEGALPRLDDAERRVLRLRFADDRTFRQIGDELGLAPPQAAKLLRRALDHLGDLTGQRTLAPAA